MRGSPLSNRPPIEVIVGLFDSDGALPLADLQRALGAAYAPLSEAGVFAPARTIALAFCRDCGDDHPVVRRARDGTCRYECSCPQFGTRVLEDFDPRCFRIAPLQLARLVFAAVLERGDVLASDRCHGTAWEAMTAEGPLPRPVFLARRLDDVTIFKKVERRLQRVVGGGAGVLVTSSPSPEEFSISHLEVFEMARLFNLGADGLRIAAAPAKSVRAVVARRSQGRPNKDPATALQLLEERAKANECARGLTAESEAISALMKQTFGAKAPEPRTVESWIRKRYWELFPDRRRRRANA